MKVALSIPAFTRTGEGAARLTGVFPCFSQAVTAAKAAKMMAAAKQTRFIQYVVIIICRFIINH